MNTFTRFALVLLRIAIGWHFLFEGIDKVQTHLDGPTEAKPQWTSEPYLRGATGPFAPYFQKPLGPSPDDEALERLTLPDTKPGEPATLQPALEKDWAEQFNRFVEHYQVGSKQTLPPEFVATVAVAPLGGMPGALPWMALGELNCIQAHSGDTLQLALMKCEFEHARAEAIRWLQSGNNLVERKFSRIEEKVEVATPDRIAEYRKKLQDLREIEAERNPAFGHDVYKKKTPELRKEVARSRKELLDDVNRPLRNRLDFAVKSRLTKSQRDLGNPPQEQPFRWIWWIDRVTMWGLVVVGGCLLFGLFTRTACVLGAAFLLSLYLTMPPWPWLAQDPGIRSHFLFVNLTLIEFLALLTLATTRSGKWLGLDGLVSYLNPFSYRKGPPRPITVAPVTSNGGGRVGQRLERAVDRSPHAATPIQQKEHPHGP
jgi:uncharacterized membrane protein YphA (DoxX/SURF4 family)